MSVVHRGVPDGNEIMQKFGGDAKKKNPSIFKAR